MSPLNFMEFHCEIVAESHVCEIARPYRKVPLLVETFKSGTSTIRFTVESRDTHYDGLRVGDLTITVK